MKKLIFLGAAFLLAMNLFAQGDPSVVILSTTGKVALISAGKSKAKPVQAGALAKPTGQLKLAEGAKATLLCNGQFKEVSGPQTTALSSLCDGSGTRKMDIDFEFAEKVMAAVDMVEVAKQRGDGWSNSVTDPKKTGDGWGNSVTDPKKTGDGWGNSVTDPKRTGDGWGNSVTNPKKTGDGWGGKGSLIRLIMPFGKVTKGNTTFFWSKPESTESYELFILDVEGKILYSATVKDTFANIDLNKLNLPVDQIYHWKVVAGGSKTIESNEFVFGLGTEQEFKNTIGKAKNSLVGDQSSVIHTLVEAVALENEEWYYAANQAYAGISQKDSNNLVRIMHAAFWMRFGFKRLAEKVAQAK